MEFKIKELSLQNLYKRRNLINFPVYQRGTVWFEDKQVLLVDSIMRGIDIPKLYLQKTREGYDCIDGNQRINAILNFFDGEFEYHGEVFSALDDDDKYKFENYKLTIVEVRHISEEEVRLLFLRLQLGVPLNSGEKLNAIKSKMREFVNNMVNTQFIKNIGVTRRRFAKEQICAQICNNSLILNKSTEFKNSKFEDLQLLYTSHKDFDSNSRTAKEIMVVLKKMNDIFGILAIEIRNRASVVSIYLFIEELYLHDDLDGKEKIIKKFYIEFLKEIRKQVRLGIDATNRFLISYQSKVIQGADNKSAIKYRHDSLKQAFDYYISKNKIIK